MKRAEGFTVSQVAAMLGLSGHRVRALIREQRIPAVRINARGDYRVLPDGLREYLLAEGRR
jgi:excisionase family DNA binding protein